MNSNLLQGRINAKITLHHEWIFNWVNVPDKYRLRLIKYRFEEKKFHGLLNRAIFRNSIFIKCDFKHAIIDHATYFKCTFIECDFTYARMTHSRFRLTKFVDCIFTSSLNPPIRFRQETKDD